MRVFYLGAALLFLRSTADAVGPDGQSVRKMADGPLSCDPDMATLSFLGLLMGVSMDLGKFSLEWEDAELEYQSDRGAMSCSDPSFDIFLAPAPFNYTPYEIPDLIDLVDTSDDMMHFETDERFMDIDDLEPETVYSVLVTSHSERILYSENRESVDLKVAGCNCAMEPDVNFLGSYDAITDNMFIEYDNFTLSIETDKLPEELVDVKETDFLGVITSFPYDENFIFKVEAVGKASNTRVELTVIEASLVDLFQELDLDMAERIEKPSDSGVGDERRDLATKTLFDKKFEIDKTKKIGPLTARGRIVLRAYLKVSVSISFKIKTKWGIPVGVKLKRASASSTIGGSMETLHSLAYSEAAKHATPLNIRLWTGSRSRKVFTVGIVPVYISYRPKLDLTGHVSVRLSSDAKVALTQKGSISATVGYSKSRGWYADSKKSFSQDLDTKLDNELYAKAKVGATFWLDIDVYGVIGMDIGLYGGVGVEAEAISFSNPLLLKPPYALEQFDVFAFLELPAKGTSIFGDKNFGNLFSLEFPLLELPEIEVQRVALKKCTDDSAIILRLKAVQKKYTLPIKNRIEGPHQWILDEASELSDVAQHYIVTSDTTDEVKWRLPRSAINKTDFFELPRGSIYFRTTPRYPGLDRTLVKQDAVLTWFGTMEKFECCSNSDCRMKFGNRDNMCNDNRCVPRAAPPPKPAPDTANLLEPTLAPTPDPSDPDVTIYKGIWGEWQYQWQGYGAIGYYICGAAVRFDDRQGVGDKIGANGLRLTYCDLNDWNKQTSNVEIYPGLEGSWNAVKMCPVHHYVDGAQVKFEIAQGDEGDDTALNGLKLHCRSSSEPPTTSWVTVHEGVWGKWKTPVTRDGMFAKLVKVKVQSSVGDRDDTAWNGLKFLFEKPSLMPKPSPDTANLVEPTLAPSTKPTPTRPKPILDFSTLPNGTPLEQGSIKGDEWVEHYGVRLVSHPGPLRILDSTKAAGSYGSPNELCERPGTGIGSAGEPDMPGQNCGAQGNILIMGEGVPGTIIFDFMKPYKSIATMSLINVDQNVTVNVVSLLPDNTFDVLDIDVPSLGVNSFLTVPLYTDNVVQIQVIMVGAGAVAALKFDEMLFASNGPSLATPRVSTCNDITIDFDTMPDGDPLEPGLYVSDEWMDYGMLVSSSDGKKVRLFDSLNPTGSDYDLGSPNLRCSSPGLGKGEGGEPDAEGENCEPLGNVLIIQDGTAEAEHDDDRRGGIIHFDFTSVTVLEIGLLDIEDDEDATITVVTVDGSEETIGVDGLGTNSVQTVSMNAENVSRLSFTLAGSGAVTFIRICA